MVAQVIGVRFREAAKMYHFASPNYSLDVGDYVVVETAHGPEMARVVTVPDEGDQDDEPGRLSDEVAQGSDTDTGYFNYPKEKVDVRNRRGRVTGPPLTN